jgi:NAD(P)-dependent dehydrogenase (short-subunit alcohol dehydrogenase family)
VAERLVLVTGVGRAGQVGEAVAGAFAKRGDRVVVVSRQADESQARAAELAAAGFAATGYGADLSNSQEVDALAARVRAAHGERLDALVNLAGGFAASVTVAESRPEAWSQQWQINLATAYHVTRAFLPMLRAAHGAIVFFASEAALPGARVAGVSAYATAKSGVVTLMRAVAQEERDTGVRSNAVAPAAIRTTQNVASMGAGARLVEREDVAAAVLFLCTPAANAVTGQVIRLG